MGVCMYGAGGVELTFWNSSVEGSLLVVVVFLSGWYCNASFLYALLMSFRLALWDIPRIE